jgi:hypothetical protein
VIGPRQAAWRERRLVVVIVFGMFERLGRRRYNPRLFAARDIASEA